MWIDWVSFTPWTAAAGGVLIGISAAALLLLNGRVAGISGILGGLIQRQPGQARWRLAFVVGLMMAPTLWVVVAPLPEIQIDASFGVLALAGCIVGFGTRLGSGCTSGHGVCGLSRLSVRSLAATVTFMAVGFATVYVLRHVLTV